jgi:hypothetical protein
MTHRELHIFDLDQTLWDLQYKVWLIDKEEPSKPIVRLSSFDFNMIQQGIYRKDNLRIDYNDNTYYLNKELVDKIRRKKNIPLERIGLSLIELTQKEYINTNTIEYLTHNIQHLKQRKDVDIVLLTGRADRGLHEKILNQLREQLQSLGLNIFKIYFVGTSNVKDSDSDITNRKCDIIIEHLIGIKIEKLKFIPKKQDIYNVVHFYDDLAQNIEGAKNINRYLTRILKQTEDSIYYRILERLKNEHIVLYTHLVSTNLIQPFDTNEIKLTLPIKYSIQEKENSWKYIQTFKLFEREEPSK